MRKTIRNVLVLSSLMLTAAVHADLTVYTVSENQSVFNFTEHAWSSEQIGHGIRFSYTATTSNEAAIVADTLNGVAVLKTVLFHGEDSTFSDAVSSINGSETVLQPFSATAGTRYFFTVAPVVSSGFTYDVRVHIVQRCTLTVSADPSEAGTTTPSGETIGWTSFPFSVTASPSLVSYFSHWSVSQDDSITDSTDAATSVLLSSSRGFATARMIQKPLRTITFVNDTFNFVDDGGIPETGVLFQFIAPHADSFYITVGPGDAQDPEIRWTYYSTDESFSTPDSSSGTGTSVAFSATAASQHHYFRITPSQDYSNNSFAIKADSFYTLIIVPNSYATFTPADTFLLKKRESQPIQATLNNPFCFFHEWTIVSGTAQLTSTNILNTTVTMDSSDVVLTAVIDEKQVYPVEETAQTYRFSTQGNNVSGGILLGFTAPYADSFSFRMEKLSPHNSFIYYYGTDATFSTPLRTINTTSTTLSSFTFTAATSGEHHYFRINNTSVNFDTCSFSARVAHFCSLTVSLDPVAGPVDDTVFIINVSVPFPVDFDDLFTISGRHYFDNWVTDDASIAIDNPEAAATDVTLEDHGTITAACGVRPILEIHETWDTLTYEDISGGSRGGILFSFTADEADDYQITIQQVGSARFSVFNYGTDTTCTILTNAYTRQSYRPIPLTAASAGEVHYLRVAPSNSNDSTARFRIRYFQEHTLILEKEAGDTLLSFDTVSLLSNEVTTIDTPSVTAWFYFHHWTVVSGTAAISDSTIYTPEISIRSDAVIRAIYRKRPVTPLHFAWDTIGYQHIEGGTRGGLLFSFTPAYADTFALLSQHTDQQHTRQIYYFGTDSTFTTLHSLSTTNNSSTTPFRTAAADERHYFRIKPYNAADTTDSIQVRIGRFITVMTTSAAGTTSPESTIVAEYATIAVTTAPVPPSRYFDHWEITDGSAVIHEATEPSTYVTVDSVDVTAEAFYLPKTRFPVTTTETPYMFGTHGGRDHSGGVLFTFIPPGSDTFSIVISPSEHTPNTRLYFYGNDSTFEHPTDSASGTDFTYVFGATTGTTCYFRVAPVNSGYDRDNYGFTICYKDVHRITFTAASGGSVQPADPVSVSDGFSVQAIATPSSDLFVFDEWNTLSGTVDYTTGDSSDSIILVTPVGGDAHLEARFSEKTVYPITHEDVSYRFSNDGAPSGGILFSYVTVRSDSIALRLTMDTVFRYYRIDYYGDDGGFSNISNSLSNQSAQQPSPYIVQTPQSDDTLYFRVTTTANNYDHRFSIRVDTTVLLRLSRDPAGTIQPTDSIHVLKHLPTPISATPASQQSRFSVWRTLSGSPQFGDSTAAATTVTITDDTHVHAVFTGKAVHTVSYEPDTMTYSVEGAPVNSGGILLRYVAATADSFEIAFSTAGYGRAINYYYYATDSTFTTTQLERTGRPETTRFGFRSEHAGESHYFRVTPTLANYYTDSLVIRVLGFSRVAVTNDGRGTTNPADTTMFLQGIPHTLTATPASTFYRFGSWHVSDGNVTIADTLDAGTTFIVDPGTAVISAAFTEHTVHTIPMMPQQATYAYTRDVPAGVFLSLETETADSFDLFIRHYHPIIAKEVTYFGTDNRFANEAATVTLRETEETAIPYPAFEANASHYFRITPYGSFGDSVTVMWIPFRTLKTVSGTGGAITSPYLTTRRAGDTAIAVAIPSDSLYLFDHWDITEGSATIVDPLSATTAITLHPQGDATVTAYFIPKPHDTLIVEDDGNGITVPYGVTLVDTASDTMVTAYPNSRYIFDHWEIVSGDPEYTDQMQTGMRIRLNGTTRIRARFVPEADTKPGLTIHTVDISNHPAIELTATLRDRFGQPIPDADALTYNVRQDNIYVPHTVASISGLRGISTALVIDRSLSMSQNSRMDSALASVSTFIDAMDNQDRAAIVSFSTGVTVNQPSTSDKSLLHSALSTIIPVGETAIRDGAYAGIEQLVYETNTRAVIIFSDGAENASTRTLDATIDFARRFNVTIYTIAFGTEDFESIATTLRPLADSTGGYFFYARNAAELTGLYREIRTDIESRVVIRYISPDTQFNGDTHIVTCATDLYGTVVQDTGYWNEDNRAPTITLTQSTINTINTEQPSGEALGISAYITDDDTIIPVRTLLYQIADASSPQIPVPMRHVSDSQYIGSIPASDARKPGITFYITAADSHNTRTTIGPYRINMDNSGPVIVHTPPEHLNSGEDLHLSITASDSDSVTSAVIYYRSALTTVFTRDTLVFVSNDTFAITINGNNINSAWFEYYFEAEDSFGALSRNPVSSTYRIQLNQQPQIIFDGPATVYEGDTFSITATAFDPENELTVFTVESALPEGCTTGQVAPYRFLLTWKTGSADVGVHRIIFSTSDGNYTTIDTLLLTVKDINYPPSIIVPDDISATEGDSIGFIITGHDPDGTVLKFDSFNLPPGATFVDHNNDTVSVIWKTGSLDAGVYFLTFTATDGETTVRDTLRISIGDYSFSPPEIFASTYDTIIPSGQQITITIWATDADKTPPTLQLEGIPESAVITGNDAGDSAVFTWIADEDQANITAVAFDKLNSSQSDTLRIRITVGLFYTTAALLDTNGNGIFDRIDFNWCEEASLLDELPQPGEWIDSIIVTDENDTRTSLEPLSLQRIDDKRLSLILRESTTPQTGFKVAAFHLSRHPVTTEALPSIVDTTKDKTGPVITKAVYHPGTSDEKNRTITLHFSEPVSWLQVTTYPHDFLRYYHDGEPDTVSLTRLPVVKYKFTDSVVLDIPESFTFSLSRDSLSLRRSAADGRTHLSDTTIWRNLPHKESRRIAITTIDVPIATTAAVYDTNGNGYIDRIIFSIPSEYRFPEKLPPVKEIFTEITVAPHTSKESFALTPEQCILLKKENRLLLQIKEPEAPRSPETGWNDFSIVFSDAFRSDADLSFTVTTVMDFAGPVINKASVLPASQTGIGYDTLDVTFSEPVTWISTNPDVKTIFSFSTSESFGRGSVFGNLSDNALIAFDSIRVRIVMDNGFVFRPNVDSIQIHVSDNEDNPVQLHDLSGTMPHHDNRKVSPEYPKMDNPIGNAYICPNPFIPGISIDPTSGRNGALIVVEFPSAATECEGKFTIFDALGSVVLSDKKLHVNETAPTWLSYLWDGKNGSGAIVGNGVYFVKIAVINRSSGATKQFGIKAGVKHVDN